MPHKKLALITALTLTAVSLTSGGTSTAQAAATPPAPSEASSKQTAADGAMALSGDEAAAYRLPSDLRRRWTAR